MRVSAWNIAALVVLAWFLAQVALGGSTSGVFLNSPQANGAAGSSDPNQLQSACQTDHMFSVRNWGSFETIRYDVWVDGCVDASGALRLASPPRCSAKSFLGPATATCSASREGNRLKVSVETNYPLGLGMLAGFPNPPTFYLGPSSYSVN